MKLNQFHQNFKQNPDQRKSWKLKMKWIKRWENEEFNYELEYIDQREIGVYRPFDEDIALGVRKKHRKDHIPFFSQIKLNLANRRCKNHLFQITQIPFIYFLFQRFFFVFLKINFFWNLIKNSRSYFKLIYYKLKMRFSYSLA